ncbi:MAG: hypothetical protein J4G18_11765 [Anaerolineae bacterium]|nr:hypothetical protein [Anaerolineae bacterium]
MINRINLRPNFDPGLLLCLLLTLFLVLPLAQNQGLPMGAETKLHFQQLAETHGGFSDGGLTYLLAEFIQRLLGLGAFDALRALLILCFALCSGGMYLFCKRRCGRLGALIAGLVYVYSPTLMYDTPYARGAYSELLALALFPLLLWRVDDLRDKAKPASFLLVCLLQAALLHTRLTTALTLTGITLSWLLFETLIQQFNREASQMRAHSSVLAGLAMLLGILVSATVWLPTAQASATPPPKLSGSFLTLEDLLSKPPLQDAGAINGLRELPNLGLAQWGLAGLGALAALALFIGGYRTRHPNAFLGTAFFAGLALILITLMQLGAPSRLLGPSAACLAIVASMNGLWLGRLNSRYQSIAVAILVAAPIVTVIPLLYVPGWQTSLETAVEPDALFLIAVGDISALVSAASMLLALAISWRLRNWQLTPRPYWTTPALPRTSVVGILLGGAIALLSLLITFREGIAWISSPPGQALSAQVQHKVSLDGNVQLLGYDLNADVLRPGDRFVFKAYWYALKQPTDDYSSFLRLSAAGAPLVQAHNSHPGNAPWGPDGYIVDQYELRLPADLPAGDYDLVIGLIVCELLPLDKCAADESSENSAATVGSAVITTIRVESP